MALAIKRALAEFEIAQTRICRMTAQAYLASAPFSGVRAEWGRSTAKFGKAPPPIQKPRTSDQYCLQFTSRCATRTAKSFLDRVMAYAPADFSLEACGMKGFLAVLWRAIFSGRGRKSIFLSVSAGKTM